MEPLDPSSSLRHRLLLLAREADQATRFVPLLRRCADIEVRRVDSGLDLLLQYVRRRAAVVVIDADAGGGEVPKLVHIIRNVDRECRLVLLVSQASASAYAELTQSGGLSLLVKPASDDLVAHLICSLLGIPMDLGGGGRAHEGDA